MLPACLFTIFMFSGCLGVEALFSFDVEGDVGVDPNHMVLWFNQANLGLPAKVFSISIPASHPYI